MASFFKRAAWIVVAIAAGIASLDLAVAALMLARTGTLAGFPLTSLAMIGTLFSTLAAIPWSARSFTDEISQRWLVALLLSTGTGVIMGFIASITFGLWPDSLLITGFFAGLGLASGVGTSLFSHATKFWDKD